MNVPKKVTDFIVLEEASISRKAAVVTGAALAASVLGTVLTAQTARAWEHEDHSNHCNHDQGHGDHADHTNCFNGNCHGDSTTNYDHFNC
jgi:hypothetical protein